MLKVHVSNRQKGRRIGGVSRLKKMLQSAAPPEWDGAELDVALVDDMEMAELNKRHTGRDGDTDVLAFPMQDTADRLIGEVVVSASLAAAEAGARGIAPEEELALYALHGALHIMGFDDHSPGERNRMYARERELLQSAGYPDVRRQRRLPRGPQRALPKSKHRRTHKQS